MISISPEKDLSAVGRLAGRLGVDVDTILRLIDRLEIAPAMRVDRVVFLDRDQVAHLTAELQRQQESSKGAVGRMDAAGDAGDKSAEKNAK